MLADDIRVGVCGAGAMGAGIAQVAAQAGHKVVVFDTSDAALERGRLGIDRGLAGLVKRERLTAEKAAEIGGRLSWTTNIDDMAPCGLVIEAIFENLEVKNQLFAKVEAAVGPDCVIASNTSSLSITALGAPLRDPSRFIGLHFFNPPPIMKLVEVAPGPDTDGELVPAAMALMTAWGKVAVKVKDTPGFIVNRVARPFYSEGWRAYEEGAADAATLDHLYRDLAGFRMGPLELGDTIGHDINFATASSIFESYFGRTRFTPSVEQGQLVAAGKLGRKSGGGVYSYAEGAAKIEPAFLDAGDVETAHAALVLPSDGRTAGAVALATGQSVAVYDHVASARASTFAFAASDESARQAARAHAAANGLNAVELTDRPGLVVLRTLLQLVNAAGDAVRDRVGSAEGIDLAMMNGVNYPFGLFAWGAKFGWANVVAALEAIAIETGDASYQPGEVPRALARR